jgi:hypothetical protein
MRRTIHANFPNSSRFAVLNGFASKILSVVVVPTVAVDAAAPEVRLDQLQDVGAPFSLHNREYGLQLPPETNPWIPLDRIAEAAFTIDEADDPLLDSWPFLLIVRTRRIVTNHAQHTLSRRADIDRYRGMLGCPSI